MNSRKTSWGVAILAIVVAPLTMASACPGEAQQSGPDPQTVQMRDVQIKAAYRLPDGFRNVVEFCDEGGNMILVTSRGSDLAGGPNGGGLSSSLAVIVGDKRCPQPAAR